MNRWSWMFLMLISLIIAIGVNENRKHEFMMNNYNLASDVFIDELENPNQYITAIDYYKPVTSYQVKKGDRFIQYQVPGAPQGNFYAFEGSTPTELGISNLGYDFQMELVVEKEMRTYIATKDFVVLSSYAAPVTDDWSTPQIETQTEGHARQLFTTCKECFDKLE